MHGRGYLDQLNSAHVDRSQHAGYVADYAAAECNHDCLAIRAEFHQIIGEFLNAREPLEALAITHFDEFGVNPAAVRDFTNTLPQRRRTGATVMTNTGEVALSKLRTISPAREAGRARSRLHSYVMQW